MCNPLAIAGITVAAGGAYMKSRQDQAAANSAESAATKILNRDAKNQLGLEEKRKVELAAALKGQSRPEMDASAAGIEQETKAEYEKAVANDYNGDRSQAATADKSSGQEVVNEEYRKRLTDALGFHQQQSAAKAKLGAPAEANQRLAIANQGRGNRIAINNAISRGNSALAQDQAQRAFAKKMKKVGKFGIGDALQIAGSLASMGSGSLLAAGAAAAPTAINAFGTTPAAPVGTQFAATGSPAPALY